MGSKRKMQFPPPVLAPRVVSTPSPNTGSFFLFSVCQSDNEYLSVLRMSTVAWCIGLWETHRWVCLETFISTQMSYTLEVIDQDCVKTVAVAHWDTVLEVTLSMAIFSASFAVLPGSIFGSLEDRFWGRSPAASWCQSGGKVGGWADVCKGNRASYAPVAVTDPVLWLRTPSDKN